MMRGNAFTNPLPGVPNIESPFFDDIFSSMDIDDATLTTARHLRDHGWAVIDFPEPDFDRIAENIIASLNPLYDWDTWKSTGWKENSGLRIQDAFRFNPDVRRLAVNDHIIELLTKLYGRKAWPFQTLNFPVSTQQHFHTDSVHFSCVPERYMCGVWVALEDVGPLQGPLVYYPGSHKWPIYTNEHIGFCVNNSRKAVTQALYEPLWEELVRALGVRPLHFHAKKGQALIWAANLLHGGERQNDPTLTRWSQVTHYYFDGCAYYTPMLSDPIYGKIAFRSPEDIKEHRYPKNMYAGYEVPDSFIFAAQIDDSPRLPLEFCRDIYLTIHKDVAESGMDPEYHYLTYGRNEGRRLR